MQRATFDTQQDPVQHVRTGDTDYVFIAINEEIEEGEDGKVSYTYDWTQLTGTDLPVDEITEDPAAYIDGIPEPDPEPDPKELLQELMEQEFLTSCSAETAAQLFVLYPEWDSKTTYSAGDRVRYGGLLYQATADPKNVEPELSTVWTTIRVTDTDSGTGTTTFDAWAMPTTTSGGYNYGDCVAHNGKNWVSTQDNNWTEPGQSTVWTVI